MIAKRWKKVGLVLAAALASACSAMHGLLMSPTVAASRFPSGLPDDDVGTERAFLPWAADMSALIIVDKRSRRLALYRNGKIHRVYPVVLGRNAGRKLWEGDQRTPSGLYRITSKRPHPKYDRFLDINYPNAEDLANYRVAQASGLLPKARPGSRLPGPGSLLGIHGTDKEELNRVGVNWTLGCVSLLNRDVEELYQLVEPGTLVLIGDGRSPERSIESTISSAR